MKTVALIGDSIRMGYQPEVVRLLEGRAKVYGPAENCRFSLYTLWSISAWLGEAGEDLAVIHWNNGIWDAFRHLHDGETFASLAEYEKNLRRIIGEIRRAKPDIPIVFATTTPVHPEFGGTDNATIARFNAAAKSVMDDEKIEINDLNGSIAGNLSYLSEDKLHLSPAGYAAAARQVVSAVEKYL
jgi:lysophospholipase L1-like esterase